MSANELLAQALQLSDAERAEMVMQLIRSLDPPGTTVSEEEAEKAWAEELEVRSDAYHSGEMPTGDAREVIAELKNRSRARSTP